MDNTLDDTNDDNLSTTSCSSSSSSSSVLCLFDDLLNDEIIEIDYEVFMYIEEYIDENIIEISNPLFHVDMCDVITECIYETIQSIYEVDGYDDPYKDVLEFVKVRIDTYVNTIMNPPRSYMMDENVKKYKNVEDVKNRLDLIRYTYQPVQRTTEWYEYRHNLLTASSVSKILGSDAKKNSLIFEKCQPIAVVDNKQINVSSPMHWGNKYEPVSLMLYEHIYDTVVEDFGCIKHPIINCLGASPDGINTCTENDLYGRMVEIKNIVNREINGIPLEAYWVQMQTQMEVCNLDECDFFETQFKEFTIQEFYHSDHKHTGLILYFIALDTKNLNPHYVYMPLQEFYDYDTVLLWIKDAVMTLKETHRLYEENYWYLEKMSCVLVPRNRKWFEKLSPKIESTWALIENERVNGCEHRKPKTRNRKCNVIMDGDTKIIKLT
jgi:putative phage-type endonuclease